MTKSNKYVHRWEFSEVEFRQLLKLSCFVLTATQIAEITHLSCNSINKYLKVIRQRIAKTSPLGGLYRKKLSSTVTPIVTAGGATTAWAMPSNFGSIMAGMHLHVLLASSMVSKDLGTLLKPGWSNVVVCNNRRSVCI